MTSKKIGPLVIVDNLSSSSAHAKQPARTAPTPSLAKPAPDAPEKERIKYCDSLMEELLDPGKATDKGTEQIEHRTKKLVELAEQLAFCRSEKPTTAKVKEGMERAACFTGRLFLPRHRVGIGFGRQNEVVLHIPSQREMGHLHATPQKKYFDFVMSRLTRTNHQYTAYRFKINGLSCKFGTTYRTTTASQEELNRREMNAPVWAELIKHAPHYKTQRQAKLLQGVKECFENLPEDRQAACKTRIVHAFGDSFVHLAAAIPALDDPAHPDVLSDCQTTAIQLLRDLYDDMSPEQQTAVRQALDKLLESPYGQIMPAWHLDVSHMRRSFNEPSFA